MALKYLYESSPPTNKHEVNYSPLKGDFYEYFAKFEDIKTNISNQKIHQKHRNQNIENSKRNQFVRLK